MSACLELELPALPEGVPRARRAVSELCEQLDLQADVVERVRIAVNEACTNCVVHAYADARMGSTFMLETRVEDEALLVVVHDCGLGLAHVGRNGGLGFGLRMIEELADSTQVSSRSGFGTRVAMRFAARLAG